MFVLSGLKTLLETGQPLAAEKGDMLERASPAPQPDSRAKRQGEGCGYGMGSRTRTL